jgi:hypothetical protein
MYPMLADIYYPIIAQNEYGKAIKEWIFDRTVSLNAQPITTRLQEETSPTIFLQTDGKLKARCRSDLRISSNQERNNITNILVTNIRFPGDEAIYMETAGPRSGRGTIFEVGTFEPFVGLEK